MKAKDYHWLTPRSNKIMVPVALLTLLALFWVERGREVVQSPLYDEMLQASEVSGEAARHLKQLRLQRGVFVDHVNDPAETALIGQEYTQITTDRGSLEAKLTSTDPNFAAVAVDMLRELGLKRGSCVAVAVTGSFPALNLSMLAAIETLALRPVLISSMGASNYGANDPYFTWLDMEREVHEQGILRTRSVAASLGGGNDVGRGLSPKGRHLLRLAAERNAVPLLETTPLESSITHRMDLYREVCHPEPIAAYVNVGGGVASLGHSLNAGLIPDGPSLRLPRRNFPARGVLLRLAEEGVPVVQLSNVRQLRNRYGLDGVDEELPLPGQGAVYAVARYSLPRTFLAAVALFGGLAGLFAFDRHIHRLGQTPGGGAPLPVGRERVGFILFLMLCCSHQAFAQATVPIVISGKERAYQELSATEPQVVTVRGPGELRLISRARFPSGSEDKLDYSLRLRIDGVETDKLVYRDVERSSAAVFRNRALGDPGRLMDHRLRLGRGVHNVEVVAGVESPRIYFRHLFQPTRERRRDWVTLAPLPAPESIDIVVRETVVPYYRNTPGNPFQVEVIGPTELRIFTRVENTPDMRGRIHYRLQVRAGERVINTFQLSSRRSELAEYRDLDHLVPGRAAEVVIPVPPGLHRIQIVPLDPDKPTLLARFMLPREDLALSAE